MHNPETDTDRLSKLPRKTVWIAVDGGIDFFYRQNKVPAYAIGDFDSASEAALKWIKSQPTHLHRYPRSKNQSDTELALDLAHQLGTQKLILTALSGGEPDHFLFNLLSILSMASRRFQRALLVEPSYEAEYLYGPSERNWKHQIGSRFSFLPLQGACNLTLKGFLYELEQKTVQPPTTLTLSNTITKTRASLSLKFGEGLYFLKEPTRKENNTLA